MTTEELLQVIDYLDAHKESLLPILEKVVDILDAAGGTLEPMAKKILITKSVEYTTEKFKRLLDNGFNREEAIQIIVSDNNALKKVVSNAGAKKN